tara:strand:- start:379 stop:654 length:276 start_codon:yes stop_codon:yes gene_type:complete
MKSSYELAMERFGDGDDSKALTDEQKAAIAEIEVKYKAKIAERKIFLEKSLADALATENEGEAEEIRRQIAEEVSALEEEAEQAKEKIRQA